MAAFEVGGVHGRQRWEVMSLGCLYHIVSRQVKEMKKVFDALLVVSLVDMVEIYIGTRWRLVWGIV